MRTITPEQITEILKQHAMWLADPTTGQRANLCDANLRHAGLRRADLRDADLRGANLYDANLCDANLRHADLRGANLYDAGLRRADLCGADLCGADLRDADLYDADLRGADLRGADLCGATLPVIPIVPIVPSIDAAILAAIEREGCALNMDTWHTCKTVHCRAGWAIILAGEAGAELERKIGPAVAAALIYAASGSHPVPDWYATHDAAMMDLRARAGR